MSVNRRDAANGAEEPLLEAAKKPTTGPATAGTLPSRKGRRASTGSDQTGQLLDVAEVASMLNVKPSTVYQWVYQRKLTVVKLFGSRGALRFRQSDIEQLISKSVRPALRSGRPDSLDS
jgi:excisionase family DNA binding protein